MNWKKGLVRLWVLLAVLWVGSTSLFASNIIFETFNRPGAYQYETQTKKVPWEIDWTKPFYEIAYPPGKGKWPDTFSKIEYHYVKGFEEAVSSDTKQKIELPNGSLLYLPSGLSEADQLYLAQLFWDKRWGRYLDQLSFPVSVIFLPPLAVLLLGLAFWWVGRGFSRQ